MKNAIKVLCFVLAVIIIGTSSVLVYFKWDKGSFKYENGNKSGTVEITEYIGDSVNIIIPDRIRGKKVTAIGDSAFSDTNIVSVKVNKYITSIRKNAFQDCKKLESITLGESVTNLGDGCFSNCDSLKTVFMSESVSKYGEIIFGNDTALEKVDFGNNKNFVCENGVIYSADKTVLYEALPYADLTEYNIPSTVKEIHSFAFLNHTELTKITLSSGIINIPEGCFSKCTGLKELVIPSNVQIISGYFITASGVTTITIPKTVTKIDKSAFYNMESKVTIITTKSSAAERFANDNKIKTKIVEFL